VTCADEVLCRASSCYATSPIRLHEDPHEAALRILRDDLQINASADHLLTHALAPGLTVPPSSVEFNYQNGEEQVTLVYVYRQPERIPPPSGWDWMPKSAVALP
jgi:hypothetical protein